MPDAPSRTNRQAPTRSSPHWRWPEDVIICDARRGEGRRGEARRGELTSLALAWKGRLRTSSFELGVPASALGAAALEAAGLEAAGLEAEEEREESLSCRMCSSRRVPDLASVEVEGEGEAEAEEEGVTGRRVLGGLCS